MNQSKLKKPIKITAFYQNEVVFDQIFTKFPIILGRSPKCDIPLPQYDFLSRQHCSVTMEGQKIIVCDLESSNGIFFKGKRVQKAEIDRSVEIEIGELHLKFEEQESASTQDTIVDEITKVRPNSVVLKKSIEKTQKEAVTQKHHAAPEKEILIKKQIHLPEAAPSVIPSFTASKNEEKKSIEKKQEPKKKTSDSTYKQEPSFLSKFQKPHHQANQLRPQQRVLEGFVTWKDQIYDLTQYRAGQHVIFGTGEEANLGLPVIKKAVPLASYDGNTTQVHVPKNLKFELSNEARTLNFEESVHSPLVQKRSDYYSVKLGSSDVISVQITQDVFIHLKYIPAPRQLSKESALTADPDFKKKTFISGAIHFLLFLSIVLTEPKSKVHIKNVPDRYARLIVQPPPEPKKPEPPKPPEPKKEEKKIAEKKPEPPKKVVEHRPKPKKIVKLQKSKTLAKVNKYPVEVAKPMKPADKPVVSNIQSVGALAALNAFSSKAPSDVPVAVNINKNAGGQTALNTGGVIGALKTSTGKLAAGGFASVKTKGLGYGTGTGYGVQGIKGTAGGRSVAGTVVGQPALVHLSKSEGLTRAQVMDIVKRHMAQIQQCYERSLIENTKLSGRVEYEWEISPQGFVQWAKVKKSDIAGADNLNNCVVGVFKDMKFPVAKNGQTTTPNIGFPFGRL